MMRTLVIATLIAAVLGVQNAAAPQAAPTMSLSVEVQQAAADSGSDPRVRVTIQNVGDSVLRVPALFPRELVTLIVRDHTGKLIIPEQLTPRLGSAGMMHPVHLLPGQAYVAYDNFHRENEGWVALSIWGYPALANGTYSISARPGIIFGGHSDVTLSIDSSRKDFVQADSNTVSLEIH